MGEERETRYPIMDRRLHIFVVTMGTCQLLWGLTSLKRERGGAQRLLYRCSIKRGRR